MASKSMGKSFYVKRELKINKDTNKVDFKW